MFRHICKACARLLFACRKFPLLFPTKCQRAASPVLVVNWVFRERTEDAGRSRIPSRVMRLHHSETVHLRHNRILQQKQTGPEAGALRLSAGWTFLFCHHHKFDAHVRCLSKRNPTVKFKGRKRWLSSWGQHDIVSDESLLKVIWRDDKRNDKKKKWKRRWKFTR